VSGLSPVQYVRQVTGPYPTPPPPCQLKAGTPLPPRVQVGSRLLGPSVPCSLGPAFKKRAVKLCGVKPLRIINLQANPRIDTETVKLWSTAASPFRAEVLSLADSCSLFTTAPRPSASWAATNNSGWS